MTPIKSRGKVVSLFLEDRVTMFQDSLTLQEISQLRHPSEKVLLSERFPYEAALQLIEEGQFSHASAELELSPLARIEIEFGESGTPAYRAVEITESEVSGPLTISCFQCATDGSVTCPHQWASYILLWQMLTAKPNQLEHPELRDLAVQLQKFLFTRETADGKKIASQFEDVSLDSISLYVNEFPLLQGKTLSGLLKQDAFRYKPRDISKDKELRPICYLIYQKYFVKN